MLPTKNYNKGRNVARLDNIKDLLRNFDHDFNREIDRFFHGFGSSRLPSIPSESDFVAPMRMKEDDNTIKINMEIPGVPRENIDISVDENKLIISGEKENSFSKEDDNSSIEEFSYGKFRREILLPEYADTESIDAVQENGVLKLSIAKHEKEEKEIKKIEIRESSEE